MLQVVPHGHPRVAAPSVRGRLLGLLRLVLRLRLAADETCTSTASGFLTGTHVNACKSTSPFSCCGIRTALRLEQKKTTELRTPSKGRQRNHSETLQRTARAGDDDAQAALLGRARVVEEPLRRAVRGDHLKTHGARVRHSIEIYRVCKTLFDTTLRYIKHITHFLTLRIQRGWRAPLTAKLA